SERVFFCPPAVITQYAPMTPARLPLVVNRLDVKTNMSPSDAVCVSPPDGGLSMKRNAWPFSTKRNVTALSEFPPPAANAIAATTAADAAAASVARTNDLRFKRIPPRIVPTCRRKMLAQRDQALRQQVEETLGVDLDGDVRIRLPADPAPAVGVRPAFAELTVGIDPHAAAHGLQKVRPHHVRDGDRIVHGRALPRVDLAMVEPLEADDLGDH